MAKDRIGNDLKVGDLVEFTVPDEFKGRLLARVASISEGGIAMVGGQFKKHDQKAITSGVVSMDIHIDATFVPGTGAALLLKCVDPEPPSKLAEA